nr:HDOD domain-containing protein [Fredinandcohnia onubensis]
MDKIDKLKKGRAVLEIFIARQPILDENQQIHAYELLHRSNKEKNFSSLSNDQATLDVINSFVQIGIEDLSEGKPCFINFTDTLLAGEIQSYFDPKSIVIEILETVKFTDEFIDLLRKLKTQGYKIALDDFEMEVDEPYFHTVMNLVDIVKVDIQKTPRIQQIKILSLLKAYSVELLAEKVETREEYEQCLKDGYNLFQGYFFCRPMIMSTNDLIIQKNNLFLIMSELSNPEVDFNSIANKIERDVTISYKLLKYINSPVFSRVKEIKSIKHAIIMLGIKELKKWFYMMFIREAINETNKLHNEITKISMVRAKACELIAVKIGKRDESSSYFLTGIFSLIDTLLKQPLVKVINQLPLDKEIKETLIGNQTFFKDVLDIVILLEKGAWKEIAELRKKIGIEEQDLFAIYLNSMKWAQQVITEIESSTKRGVVSNEI